MWSSSSGLKGKDPSALIKADLKSLKDPAPPQQVESNPQSIGKARPGGETHGARLDLKLMQVDGDEASIPDVQEDTLPCTVVEVPSLGDLRPQDGVGRSGVHIDLKRQPGALQVDSIVMIGAILPCKGL